LNYLKHRDVEGSTESHKQEPAEIESNAWRPFNTGKGGISNIKDESKAGHHYEAPEELNLNFSKHLERRAK